MSILFAEELRQKQEQFKSDRITAEEITNAVEHIKDALRKLTDDPLNREVTMATIYYESQVDDDLNPTGICNFWLDDDRKNILFTMTAAHFRIVENELARLGLVRSGSYGNHDGHCHLSW